MNRRRPGDGDAEEPRRSLAEILADDPDLAAALEEIKRVLSQCRIIEVDDTRPAKKKQPKKRAGKSKKP